MDKNIARLRRAKTTRSHIRDLGVARLSVLRSGQHIYAQVFTADGSKVLASASTVQADVREGLKNGKNSDAAARVGKLIAERAKAAGIEKVAFDRSGYRYHGRRHPRGPADRRARQGRRHREGRVRPLRLRVSRPRQGAGRCRARGGPPVLTGYQHGTSSSEDAG